MSIRTLSAELHEIAKKQLFEVPNRVRDDIDDLKMWIEKYPSLKARKDDQWLLSFLRGCKFSLERSKEKLIQYYSVRVTAPEFFINRNPFNSDLQRLLKLGVCIPLEKLASPSAPRVILMRSFDTKQPTVFVNMVKITLMILDILINEDDNFIVAGHVVFHDFEGTTLNHILQVSPSLGWKMINCLQNAYPTRPKQFHYTNAPTFVLNLLNVFKPFLSEKIKARIKIYDGKDVGELYQSIPKSILPKEYGGDAGPIKNLIGIVCCDLTGQLFRLIF
ncbi:hypothetical protein FQA39_LY01223 [Lamprigera yunnana]|nr:hypothetical protein FQA39_LY01223 [Lamprigera yunnana]